MSFVCNDTTKYLDEEKIEKIRLRDFAFNQNGQKIALPYIGLKHININKTEKAISINNWKLKTTVVMFSCLNLAVYYFLSFEILKN